MTPEFALDLSHDGISLLRRADDGWRRIGRVSLDADSLSDDLAALRDKAADGRDISTKLVLPNSQILFTSCPASGKDELADEVRVRAALVGATPYEVSDLVFDWESDGETLQIAVVARETLDEARAFASEHGFGPVGFVAVPPRGGFLREPFFGPADRGPAAGPGMVADAEPITVVGVWDAPAVATQAEPGEAAPAEDLADAPDGPDVPEEAAPLDEAADAPGEPVVEASVPEEAPASEARVSTAEEEDVVDVDEVASAQEVDEPGDAELEDPAAALGPPDARDETGDQPIEIEAPVEAGAEMQDAPALPDAAAEEAAAEELPQEAAARTEAETADDAAAETPAVLPSFSSIRATSDEGKAPKLGGARSADGAAPSRKLGGATRSETPASPAKAGSERTVEEAAPTEAAAPALATDTLEALKAAPVAAQGDPEISAQDGAPRSKAAFASFRDRVSALRRSEAPSLTPEIIAAPLPRPTPGDLPERISQEAAPGEFTIFGARGKKKAQARKGFPVALTMALLLFMGLVGLWSKLFLANDETVAQAAAEGEQVVASASSVPLLGEDGGLTRSITFSEAGTSGATTDPEGEAELAEALQAPSDDFDTGEPVDLASLTDDPFSAMPEDEPQLAEPMLENPPLPEIDADSLPADDEMADFEPEPEADVAPRMSAEEAQAAYTESGIWQQAPVLASLPEQESTDDIYIASIDPSVQPHDAVALPRAGTEGGTDTALPRQPGPVPPGQVVVFDDEGRIQPTEEGVVTADGITLYAGRPSVVPRARPGTSEDTTAEAELEAAEAETEAEPGAEDDNPLAGLRPRARPQGLVEENEKAQLGGRTRAELAGLRPKARPQSVQDEAEASRQAAIEEAVRNSAEESAELQQDEARAQAEAEARAAAELQNASRLAVAKSRQPAAKPRGFERKVAAARKRAEREQAEARKQAAAAARQEPEQTASAAVALPRNQKVAPRVPSSASVAKAATDRNALKLRDINLIGVFGSPSQRRALVRLPSGRLVKVKAGDRLDGGKVAAIGQSELRYVKRGRNITLSMPRS